MFFYTKVEIVPIVGDNDGVVLDSEIAFHIGEDLGSCMISCPLFVRIREFVFQLMCSCLCNKSKTLFALPDVEIKGRGTIPTHISFKIEKLLNSPTFGIVLSE